MQSVCMCAGCLRASERCQAPFQLSLEIKKCVGFDTSLACQSQG